MSPQKSARNIETRLMTQTLSIATFKIPEPTYRKVVTADRVERVDAVRPEAPDGDWKVWTVDGERVTRREALQAAKDGAEIEDPESAHELLHAFRERARLTPDEERAYLAPLLAFWHRIRTERAERAAIAAGFEPGDDVVPGISERLITREQVAEILAVDVSTVDRWAGQKIPAPVRVGAAVRYKASALASFLDRLAA